MVFTEQDELVVLIPLHPCKPSVCGLKFWLDRKILIQTVRKNYISPLSECFFSQVFSNLWSDPDPIYLVNALKRYFRSTVEVPKFVTIG
jgi:hypothetical protein